MASFAEQRVASTSDAAAEHWEDVWTIANSMISSENSSDGSAMKRYLLDMKQRRTDAMLSLAQEERDEEENQEGAEGSSGNREETKTTDKEENSRFVNANDKVATTEGDEMTNAEVVNQVKDDEDTKEAKKRKKEEKRAKKEAKRARREAKKIKKEVKEEK